MTTLVVSPHLDDAVLSVPGLIGARVRSGERVVVLTVFSEGDASHAERRAEDLAALAVLGAEAQHLGLRDAPQRLGLPRSFRDLVLTPLPAGDAEALARALAGRVRALAPGCVLLPLGVGEHLDHRAVHAAHPRLSGRVGFYEDRPYARVEHAAAARLARLGATVDGAAPAASRSAAEAFLASARAAVHLRAYLPEDERDVCLAPLAAPLTSPAAPSGLALRSETLRFDLAARRDAARAVRAYASQLADLFGGPGGVDADYGADYAERLYWREGQAPPSMSFTP